MKHTNIKYNIQLNIKSIVLYEKLTQESFALFDGSIHKIIPLLYCMIVANNSYNETYEDTVTYLFKNESLMKDLSSRLEKEMKFQQQFKSPFNEEKIDLSITENNTQNEKQVFITQMIPILVMDCGLDINYVLNEMSYTDIDIYIKYKDDKEKSKLEEKRLFTYLTVLPHIDSKKCPIDKFLPFQWEEQEKKEKGMKEIEVNQHKLQEFLNTKNNEIENNNTNE